MRTISGILLLVIMLGSEGMGSVLAPWVSPNRMLGRDPAGLPIGTGRNQAEPHAVRSVLDPDLILATFQEGRLFDGGAKTNGYAVSMDGGFSWRRGLNPRLTLLNGGPYFRATDPVAGISREGVLYLNSLVSVDEFFGLGRVVLQRSDDLGLSWSDPVTIYTGLNDPSDDRIFPDKNWMVVDNYAGSPHPGRIVVTWTNFRAIKSGQNNIEDFLIVSAHSDDGGNIWSSPVYVTPPASPNVSNLQYQGSQPVFLPGGGLAVVYHNFIKSRLEIAWSADGGATFPHSPDPVHAGYILFDAPGMREGSFLPSVSVARDTGDVYVAYVSKAFSSNSVGDIYFTRSERTTITPIPGSVPDWRFRTPKRISGMARINITVMPTVAVSPDGSWVTVYYYDNRNGTIANTSGDFYAVQSTDGGNTWGVPFRLTEETFDLRKATNSDRGYMIGDYFGFASPTGPGQAAVAVWVDTQDGNADPWSSRIARVDQPLFDSWLQANLPYAVHQAGVDALRYADPDGDGVPNLIEYVIGQSPYFSNEEIIIENGVSFLLINRLKDSATRVVVEPGTGRWPHFHQPLNISSISLPFGEGYWKQNTWSQGGKADHFKLTINNQETWYLTAHDNPFRWLRAFDDGWVNSPWFGWLHTSSAPWVFHLSLGWLYDYGHAFYSAGLDTFIYPMLEQFPWLVRQDGGYYFILEGAPWVYDNSARKWIRTN